MAELDRQHHQIRMLNIQMRDLYAKHPLGMWIFDGAWQGTFCGLTGFITRSFEPTFVLMCLFAGTKIGSTLKDFWKFQKLERKRNQLSQEVNHK